MIDTCPICNTPGMLHHRQNGMNSFEPFRGWEPTPHNIAALPKPLREFVRRLVSEAAHGETAAEADLRRELAARDQEIAELRAALARQDADFARLRAAHRAQAHRVARLEAAATDVKQQLDGLCRGFGPAAPASQLDVGSIVKRRS